MEFVFRHSYTKDRPSTVARGLGSHGSAGLGAFSRDQTQAILVVSLCSATFSLISSFVSFYWFMRMKRSFRHELILFLIISDTFKSLWYFVYPIVYFGGYEPTSKSNFCQAQGFFLALSTEASDYAILVIALHAAFYIFRPPRRLGQGGIYGYRRWIYAFWVIFPVAMASLAFVNTKSAYVTAGSFCYLPRRPFWYRLGLAWIPRYVIFFTILGAYVAIYVYVHHKFKGFGDLSIHDSRLRVSSSDPATGSTGSTTISEPGLSKTSFSALTVSGQAERERELEVAPDDRPEWEKVDFITSSPAALASPLGLGGVAATDFAASQAPIPSGPSLQTPSSVLPNSSFAIPIIPIEEGKPSDHDRQCSNTPTIGPVSTVDTLIGSSSVFTSRPSPPAFSANRTDPIANQTIKTTRIAIQRQVRFLFIYPLVYIILWIFPFVNHCLQYSDHLVAHPQFWLQILATGSVSIQAGVDAVIFSWRERPWKRRRGPIPAWARRLSVVKDKIFGHAGDIDNVTESRQHLAGDVERRSASTHWWELEGKMRKDSVWMGTDAATAKHTRQRSH